MNQESDDLTVLPVAQQHKPFVVLGFDMVKIVLADKENPLTKGMHDILTTPKSWENFYKFIDKCKNDMDGDNWEIHTLEMLDFFMLNDLTLRILQSEYKEVLREGFESHTDGIENFDNIIANICLMAQDAVDAFQAFKIHDTFASYMWSAERLPDPYTGISPAMAKFGHIPKIPTNPKQMLFKDFGDDNVAVLRKSKGHQIFMKHIKCVFALQTILLDGENPPAKIIQAFFPDIEAEMFKLAVKLRKSINRKIVRFSEQEFGLLYASTDLYGRLMASTYHDIMIIVARRNRITDLETLSDEELANQPFLTRSSVDDELQMFNEGFGELPVIKTYREVTADMPWFDD
ncbi:MAG: hypothetical protein JNL70_10565 [Saprospiraceae bacterium]|nr:hypothetical protein [Saprospiraceae bacterium]